METWNRRGVLVAAGGVALGGAIRPARAQMRTVIDTLAADGRFTQFITMVQQAGLTERLRGPGPMTVFAPTDQAFTLAPAARLAEITQESSTGSGGGQSGGGGVVPSTGQDPVRLRGFVQYYIVPGRALTLASLTGGQQQLSTENGQPLLVSAAPGQPVTVANPAPGAGTGGVGAAGLVVTPAAPVVQADVPATNGIIHVLGGVLFP
ncbi:MAG TPA: fasciclin domain-containing protein [Crenalkalicoccus sp.]|nr:fasciclin domain-containing protein [Crenalkalicoccus sp.]